MPAGDLITADWQVELRGVLMGAGSDYQIIPPGIRGLGVSVKPADIDLPHDDGDYAADDYHAARIITVPLIVGASAETAASAATLFDALRTAWAPGGDEELHIRLPGLGHFKVVGRARGLDEDLTNLKSGHIPVLATFKANDPTIAAVP